MTRLPEGWQAQLRDGARARLRGSLELEDSLIPLDLTVSLEMNDEQRLSVHLTVPTVAFHDGAPTSAQLTPRERKVVTLIGMGKETEEIARILFITQNTVRTHVRNAMSKAHAHTRAQLVARVMGAGAEDLPPPAEADGSK